jgi:GTPase
VSEYQKKLPTVALIGLPNSGKSTLINRITGEKRAITDKIAHTTRDLLYGTDVWNGLEMRFVDTGGLVPNPEDKIQKMIQIKSWQAIVEADLLVWVIDRKQNPNTISEDIIQRIWKTGKPFFITINKVDDPNQERSEAEFASLGSDFFINISATTSFGLGDLMDKIVLKLRELGFKDIYQNPSPEDGTTIKKGKRTKIVAKNSDGTYSVLYEENLEKAQIKLQRDQEITAVHLAPETKIKDWTAKPIKLVFLGKPNVGKSSLFNSLVGKEIQIVTEIPGTTLSVNDYLLEKISKKPIDASVQNSNQDLIEESIENSNQETIQEPNPKITQNKAQQYILLDTAGIRKAGQRTLGVETFATYRTIQAVNESDVVLLVFDSSLPLTHQDQVVAGIVDNSKKGLVVLFNKSDLLDTEKRAKFLNSFNSKFKFLKIDRVLWVSAATHENLNLIWKAVDEVISSRSKTIDPVDLRRVFNYLMKKNPPKKMTDRKKPVVYDLVFTKQSPPTFELWVRYADTIHWSYLRFLANFLGTQFEFVGGAPTVKIVEKKRMTLDRDLPAKKTKIAGHRKSTEIKYRKKSESKRSF